MKKLVLIDGSSLIFRAFYAIRNLTTKEGVFTNGVFGFLSMYYKVIGDIDPDYIAVAFDRSTPTFRHKDYENYKGNRDKAPDELSSQFGILKDILSAMNVQTIDVDGYEADDICGTLAKVASKEGIKTYLVTGDRDYLQLVDDNTDVIITKKGITDTKIYDIKTIREEFDLEPKQLIDVKGLMGDTSDNIPGVPGIGEKTALKYIVEYGSIDGLYDHIDEIKGKKTKERLIENKDLAYMSKNLGTIVHHAPVNTDMSAYEVKLPEYEQLTAKFERLEFRSFLEKLPKEKMEEEKEYHFINGNTTHFEEIKAYVEKHHQIVFHFFFDDDYIYNDYKFFTLLTDKCYIYQKEEVSVEFLKLIFEDPTIHKVSYDIKSDIYYIYQMGIEIVKPYEDITIAEYLIDPSKSGYEIDKARWTFLNIHMMSLEDIIGKGRQKKSWLALDEVKRGRYFSTFLNVTKDLREIIFKEIEDRNMVDLYYHIELPLVKILANMEYVGVSIDKDYLIQAGKIFDRELEELETEMYHLAGETFNINSTKQLGEILFEKMNLPVIKKTKTGYSTAQEVLEKLSNEDPIIPKILRYRKIKKLNSTYVEGLVKLIGTDGKIHSHFNQNITATGRISSTDPNLQNIPIRTKEGKLLRKAFTASRGNVLIDADYSQIELRVLAHLSKDQTMIDAFIHNADIHRKTASEVFHVPFEDVTNIQRSNAKAVNFGIVYGISDYGLSRDLNISRAEAKTYIENYLDTYTGIKAYMDAIIQEGKENGYVETIMHRRRYIPELTSKNFNIRGFGERIALNTPIQGSAADIIKRAMVRVFNRLKDEKLSSKLTLQVHDELIIDSVKSEKDKIVSILKEEMENAIELALPLIVDISIGENWYESK